MVRKALAKAAPHRSCQIHHRKSLLFSQTPSGGTLPEPIAVPNVCTIGLEGFGSLLLLQL